MAYTTLSQADDERHKLNSALTPSPTLPELERSSLSFAFEDVANTLFQDEPPENARSKVADVLKSFTSSRSAQSYELVEEDDYEQAQETPKLPQTMSTMMADSQAQHGRGDMPVRTASVSRHLPMNHPTPDLQAIQGAYVKNVARLEDSAERLSMASSLEDELQKMKQGIKRSESQRRASNELGHSRHFSSTSMSNSIIAVNATARSGGYSPSAYITSPVGSVRSNRRPSRKESRGSRLSESLQEPEIEGRPLNRGIVQSPPARAVQSSGSIHSQHSASEQHGIERPNSAASGDTFRQAQDLFTDFDGTHFSPEQGYMSRRISLAQPPLARDSRAFSEKQPGEKMVYYPAPVPVMLNLPKRLSQMNWTERDKRRTQVLSGIPDDLRQSAAWLKDVGTDPFAQQHVRRQSRPMSKIPPQLRASAFFDAPSTRSDIQLKHGSAVATLDGILDAAAHAPVSAFTDHPIAGHLGSEVYGPEPQKRRSKVPEEMKATRRRSSLSNLLAKRKSTATLVADPRQSQILDDHLSASDDDPERLVERSLAPDSDELTADMREGDERLRSEDDESGSEKDAEDVEGEEEPHQLGFLGAPTTLLAELQMRKAQQKLRNRTAANASDRGMHSTLLELDAVAQLQQKSRKTKHVALAWEDQDQVGRENNDDEDVPLGVLFPEKDKQSHININRPMGLMEKREMEENEPLSFRRARLRGEEYRPPAPPSQQPSPNPQDQTPIINLPEIDGDESEEEETLAQRAKRMKDQKDVKRVSRISLADDIANELGLKLGEDETEQTPAPEPEVEVEETLGQRKKRLQQEALAGSLKPTTSMANLLATNPAGLRNASRDPNERTPFGLQQAARNIGIRGQQPLLGTQYQTRLADNFPYMNQGHATTAPNIYTGHGHSSMMPRMQTPTYNAMNNMGMTGMNYGYNSAMSGMNMNMNMNMNMGMNMGMHGMHGMPMQSTYDAIGMGPPLNKQQRANIDRWVQNVS